MYAILKVMSTAPAMTEKGDFRRRNGDSYHEGRIENRA